MKLTVDFENTPLFVSEEKEGNVTSLFSNNLNDAKISFSGYGGSMDIELTSHSMKPIEIEGSNEDKYEHSNVSVFFRLSERSVIMLANYLNGYTKISQK